MTNATPKKRRCPRCGRERLKGLTDCYNCINNERYAKRSGRKLSSASEKYAPFRKTKQRKSAPKPIAKQVPTAPPKSTRPKRKSNRTRTRRSKRRVVVDSLPIPPIDSASMLPPRSRKPFAHKPFTLKQRAEGFNRLFSDIYQRPTTTSKILQQSGHSQAFLDAIKKDSQQLARLFDQIETKLYETLRVQHPNLDPSVLNIWYGLSTSRNATHKAIAAQLNLSVDDIAETRTAYLKHLRNTAAIATVEQIIRQAALQAHS